MNKANPKPIFQGRALPTKFAGVIDVEHFRRFTRLERFRILFGFNIVTSIRIVCQHMPNKYQPIVVVETSKQTKASEHVREKLKNVLAEQNAAGIVQ